MFNFNVPLLTSSITDYSPTALLNPKEERGFRDWILSECVHCTQKCGGTSTTPVNSPLVSLRNCTSHSQPEVLNPRALTTNQPEILVPGPTTGIKYLE